MPEYLFYDSVNKFNNVACSPWLSDFLYYVLNYILLIFLTVKSFKKSFSPLNAMDYLVRFLTNCTHRKGLLLFWLYALVALSHILKNGDHWSFITFSSCLKQRNTKIETHFVYVVSCINIIKSVENNIELTEEFHTEIILLDSTFEALNLYIWILLCDCLT